MSRDGPGSGSRGGILTSRGLVVVAVTDLSFRFPSTGVTKTFESLIGPRTPRWGLNLPRPETKFLFPLFVVFVKDLRSPRPEIELDLDQDVLTRPVNLKPWSQRRTHFDSPSGPSGDR